MDYDITIIVPVYNAEGYLAQTLGNVLNQTKKEIQVILVDDASCDGSLKIMNDARAAFGSRIEVLHMEENGGPGAARNAALDIAGGEYVGFVDADDLVDPTMYEKLWKAAKDNDADIADCGYLRDSTGAALIHFSEETLGELDDSKRSVLISCGGYNCMKIFRKALLDDNNIRFRPAYVLEDMDFLVKALICAKKVAAVPEVLYRYRDDTEGSLSKERPMDSYVDVQLAAMEATYNAAKGYENYPAIAAAVEYMLCSVYKNMVLKIIYSKKSESFDVRKKYLGKVRSARFECIHGKIEENPYIMGKFDKEEVQVVLLADSDERAILKLQEKNI